MVAIKFKFKTLKEMENQETDSPRKTKEEKDKADVNWYAKVPGLYELVAHEGKKDFAKAQKLCANKLTKGTKGYMFYAVVTAFCLIQ
jgi:hypothetical protein